VTSDIRGIRAYIGVYQLYSEYIRVITCMTCVIHTFGYPELIYFSGHEAHETKWFLVSHARERMGVDTDI